LPSQVFESLLLQPRRRLQVGRRVADFDRPAFFGHVVEEGEQAVKVALRKRVVFVVVTAAAAERQAQPDGGGRLDAVGDIFDGVFFGDDPALGVAAVVAIEAGRDLLVERRTGQQVPGDLLDRELVERHVSVEGLDHPVAPPPHDSLAVALVAAGVGVAGGVEPRHGHPFAIAGRSQQPIDGPLVRVGRMVRQKLVNFCRRRLQAGQRQRHAPEQRRPVRFR
jgi:hypothetical protein